MNDFDVMADNRRKETALPISICMYSWPFYDVKFERGYSRILLGNYDNESGKMPDDLEDKVQENDIVFVPTYGEHMVQGRNKSSNPDHRSTFYEENIERIRDLAPKVRAILLGNDASEFTICSTHGTGNLQDRKDMLNRYIDHGEELVCSAGGRLAYAPWAWDFAWDCYEANGLFRDRMNKNGGILICFCGYRLFSLVKPGGMRVPGPGTDTDEPLPRPKMRDYVTSINWAISGADGPNGIARNNDISLAWAGFNELAYGDGKMFR